MAEIEVSEPKMLVLENPEADYEKMIKELEAKVQAAANVDGIRSGSIEVTSPLTNFTKTVLTKLDVKFWAGRSIHSFPDLKNNTTYLFGQRGTLPEGVKWGYSYATGKESTDRKWVAAFDYVAGKAYCECGPTGPVDWNVVADKLSKSESKMEYVDPIFGGRIVARVAGDQLISTLW
ncbi:hypothetical protein SOVF_057160 [Spinacia oleracea]|uniref:Uncharacterized protein n=1 Tax=Spinacia oleracea TaxID=3562 RepID=A0A9R0HWR8_SPIOL|nr:uncharacterized protein LOC110778012 [Spinacia oleracea]KNA19889.1 hypothetical protein SOVF_057160 [Spinacia oleracea]